MTNLLLMLGAFVAATLIALAVGSPDLGTAMAFGQLAFAGVVSYVITQRP